jgi:alcohol dehydrogenase YqhD (iron-dependent ADH family)
LQNFIYSIPTKVAFGKGMINKLPKFINKFGSKVLLVYGGGSIKRIGLYDRIIKLLDDNGITYYDLSGVEPNPRVNTVEKGIKICRENSIDVILPIGGGSSIDCGKAIAAGYYYNGKVWDLVLDNSLVKNVLPIITVLTLAATGSEMDCFSVISNEETNDKMEIENYLLYPKYSILDPENTFSVSAYQTACGTVDIISHLFEVYFNGVKDTYFQERIIEGMLKTCVHYGPIACKKPDDYDARANLMWTASWAINGFIACGKMGPWPAHAMEHQLSAYYNVTHGHGLAVIIPALMKYILNEKTASIFSNYGKNVFGINSDLSNMQIAEKAIEKTKKLFEDMGLKCRLRDLGINTKDKFEIMAEKACESGTEECMVPLYKKDIIKIYKLCF